MRKLLIAGVIFGLTVAAVLLADTLTVPHSSKTATDPLFASHWNAAFSAVESWGNGLISDVNIENDGLFGSTVFKAGTITGDLLDSGAVITGKILEGEVTEPKMDFVNDPTEQYAVRWDAGSNKFSWEELAPDWDPDCTGTWTTYVQSPTTTTGFKNFHSVDTWGAVVENRGGSCATPFTCEGDVDDDTRLLTAVDRVEMFCTTATAPGAGKQWDIDFIDDGSTKLTCSIEDTNTSCTATGTSLDISIYSDVYVAYVPISNPTTTVRIICNICYRPTPL